MKGETTTRICSTDTSVSEASGGTLSVKKRKYSNSDQNKDVESLKSTTGDKLSASPEKKTLKLIPWIIFFLRKHIEISWKVTAFLLLLYFISIKPSDTNTVMIKSVGNKSASPLRILHIVTTISENSHRLEEILIPVLQTSVESMLNISNCEVDVYLILGYTLKPERKQLVLDALPDGVGLEIWDDATPITYEKDKLQFIQLIPRALSRQHRYVMKDKLYDYDFFTVFEDDMLITRYHVENFIQMSRYIDQLIAEASPGAQKTVIAGNLTRRQAEMLIPGYVRVEVLKPGSVSQEDKDIGPIEPINLDQISNDLDPSMCCQIPCSSIFGNPKKAKKCYEKYPSDPTSHQLIIWESAIRGFSLRQLPSPSNLNLNWVALQPGPQNNRPGKTHGYWSGQDGAFRERPNGNEADLFGQQAGFMASRDQILRFERICPGGFLPPFDPPNFRDDGLWLNNVEFWSGGFHLFGGNNCNFQRILSLDPHVFSKQLLYHASNNKQETIKRERRVKVVHLLGQLHSVREKAKNYIGNQTKLRV